MNTPAEEVAAEPKTVDDHLEVVSTHLTGVVQGDAQRKALVAALKDAIHAAIETYHQERHG